MLPYRTVQLHLLQHARQKALKTEVWDFDNTIAITKTFHCVQLEVTSITRWPKNSWHIFKIFMLHHFTYAVICSILWKCCYMAFSLTNHCTHPLSGSSLQWQIRSSNVWAESWSCFVCQKKECYCHAKKISDYFSNLLGTSKKHYTSLVQKVWQKRECEGKEMSVRSKCVASWRCGSAALAHQQWRQFMSVECFNTQCEGLQQAPTQNFCDS